jgi:NAD(P)-dependent dehydrogenase (short-subunit alcohol dehydrogenase family)
MPSLALENKVAIITGAGRGIGAATAEVFVREGARVCIASRNLAELKQVEKKIGKNIESIVADVSDEKSVRELFSTATKKFGRLDIVVNNAGIAYMHEKFSEHSTAEWDRVMSVNLRGTFFCCREAFKSLSQGGSIVNISSLAGIPGSDKFPGFTAYSVSKYGVTGLTEALALEAQKCGFRINCVAPGAVNTEMLHKNLPHLKTDAEPRNIAEIILSLCEDRMAKLNGAVIPVHTKAWTE